MLGVEQLPCPDSDALDVLESMEMFKVMSGPDQGEDGIVAR